MFSNFLGAENRTSSGSGRSPRDEVMSEQDFPSQVDEPMEGVVGTKYFPDHMLHSLSTVGFNTQNFNFGLSLINGQHTPVSLAKDYELSPTDANTLHLALKLLSQVPLNNLPVITQEKREVPFPDPYMIPAPYQPAPNYPIHAYPPPPLPPDDPTQSTLYVRNLPHSSSLQDVTGLFSQYGPVKEVRMQSDKEGVFFGY